MSKKAVTLRDVAKRAGVGVSTASYVLNGDHQRVSSAKLEQILTAARELNYRPNAIARSMVKQKTTTIGLIMAELDNPLFLPVTDNVERVLRPEGYRILLASANDVESEVAAVEMLRAQQVDGFIFMSLSVRFPTEHLEQLRAEDIPFFIINRDLEPGLFNLIQFDDRSAARAATEHLIGLGHTRIGMIDGLLRDNPQHARRRSAVERHRGWLEGLDAHHLPAVESWIVNGDYTYEGGYRATRQILTRSANQEAQPTALFVASDMMSIGALWALAEAGKRVPQDMALITIGDPPYGAYTVPPLTTFTLPVAEAGRIAARFLVDWLKNGEPAEKQHIVLNFELKVRESCGASLRQPRSREVKQH